MVSKETILPVKRSGHHPSHIEYATIAKTLCHKYPELKDKGDKYWVSVRACNYVTM